MYKKIGLYKDKKNFGNQVIVYKSKQDFFVVIKDREETVYYFVDDNLEKIYDEITIEKEIDRLSNLSVNKTALYDSKNFPLPAYIACANTQVYIYALVDETKYTISYIYVQHKDFEDINTIKSLLPQNYASSSLNIFSIFEY